MGLLLIVAGLTLPSVVIGATALPASVGRQVDLSSALTLTVQLSSSPVCNVDENVDMWHFKVVISARNVGSRPVAYVPGIRISAMEGARTVAALTRDDPADKFVLTPLDIYAEGQDMRSSQLAHLRQLDPGESVTFDPITMPVFVKHSPVARMGLALGENYVRFKVVSFQGPVGDVSGTRASRIWAKADLWNRPLYTTPVVVDLSSQQLVDCKQIGNAQQPRESQAATVVRSGTDSLLLRRPRTSWSTSLSVVFPIARVPVSPPEASRTCGRPGCADGCGTPSAPRRRCS